MHQDCRPGGLKLQEWTLQEWTMKEEIAGPDITGVDIDGGMRKVDIA